MTVLFFNCCPHGAEEEAFWLDVASVLAASGVEFVMDHLGEVGSSVLRLNPGTVAAHHPFLPRVELEAEYHECSKRWGRSGDQAAYRYSLRRIQHVVSLCRPGLVLIWNGFQPENLIVRALCKQVGCPVAYLERTPWPGCISLDREGILSDCSFLQEEVVWTNASERADALSLYGRYQSAVSQAEITWWPQPKSSESVALPASTRPILLFAGQVDSDSQCFAFSPHFESNLEAFRWTVEQLREAPVFLLGKHHPNSGVSSDFYRRQLPTALGEWRDDLPLERLWPVISGVIAVNSSVLGEAMLRGIPAFRLGRTMMDSCGVPPGISSKEDGKSLMKWLGNLVPVKSGENWNSDPRWTEFSAYQLLHHLFCIPNLAGVRDRRGPYALGQRILSMVCPEIRWSALFPSSWVIGHHSAIAQRLSEGVQAGNQLQEVRQSRPIRTLIRFRNRFAARPLLEVVEEPHPAPEFQPGSSAAPFPHPNERNLPGIFIWVPKSAGTSIWKTFEEVHGEKFLDLESIRRSGTIRGISTFGHISMVRLVETGLVAGEYFDKAFKFTIVRNPFDRAVSLYEYQIKTHALPATTSFAIFCRYLVERAYEKVDLYNRVGLSQLNPQVDWLRDRSGKIFTDYMGRFESLDLDLNRIRSRLGLPELNKLIPHARMSERRANLLDYYSPVEIDAVRTVSLRQACGTGWRHLAQADGR
jgi:hypothetical protein